MSKDDLSRTSDGIIITPTCGKPSAKGVFGARPFVSVGREAFLALSVGLCLQ
jgi:hypothetical protein